METNECSELKKELDKKDKLIDAMLDCLVEMSVFNKESKSLVILNNKEEVLHYFLNKIGR